MVEEVEIVEEKKTFPRDEKYIYKWNDTRYESAEELKEDQIDSCDVGDHVWSTTYVFGLYQCVECDAVRVQRSDT